jgi:hypothetical protein
MKFTWYAAVLPLSLNFILYLLYPPSGHGWPGGPLWQITALWCAFGVPLTMLYWIVRLVRHAWGQGSAAQPAPPAIEYGEPDSGRIFGRLS